jgi:hypothetical protein
MRVLFAYLLEGTVAYSTSVFKLQDINNAERSLSMKENAHEWQQQV